MVDLQRIETYFEKKIARQFSIAPSPALVVNDGDAHVRTPVSVGHPHLTKIFKWLSKPNQSFNFKTARMGCRPRGALVSYRAIRCCVSPVDRNMKLNFFRDGGEHKFRWGWHKSRWGWHKMRWGCAHVPPPSGGSSIRWGCAQMGVAQMGVRPSDEEACLKNQQFPSLDSGKLLTSGFFFADYRLAEKQCGTLLFPTSSRFIL